MLICDEYQVKFESFFLLATECRQYLTEIGKQFVLNVLENAVFEERIVIAGRRVMRMHYCRESDNTGTLFTVLEFSSSAMVN